MNCYFRILDERKTILEIIESSQSEVWKRNDDDNNIDDGIVMMMIGIGACPFWHNHPTTSDWVKMIQNIYHSNYR